MFRRGEGLGEVYTRELNCVTEVALGEAIARIFGSGQGRGPRRALSEAIGWSGRGPSEDPGEVISKLCWV